MTKPLQGIKVVEVAMWAFVPSTGAILADLGADVIKVEAPTGDPMRALTSGGLAPGDHGFTLSWELYNRGKRSITLDLGLPGAIDVLHKLLENADVFLTSLLPPARRRLKIEIDDIRSRHPDIIYAVGSGAGPHGPDGEKGGYDAITFWARGSVAASVTPQEASYPLSMPSAAYGDCTSGAIFSGAVCAALTKRALGNGPSVVDVSLLNSSMWVMQRSIAAAALLGMDSPRPGARNGMPNPLVNNYRTADGRFVALCMLQSQRYWSRFCEAIGHPELATIPQFATAEDREANRDQCIARLDALFAAEPLHVWRERLAHQDGQWDVIQRPSELLSDPQVLANGYVQTVDYGDGRSLQMVSSPMQFDRQPSASGPAPELGAHSEEILHSLGYGDEAILDLKIAGVVF